MRDEPVALVDETDRVIGETTMIKAHRQGLLHRVAAVLVMDPKARLLLQKRSDTGLWDVSAAGHFPPQEGYKSAAMRELSEEIGIRAKDLTEVWYGRARTISTNRLLIHFIRLYLLKGDYKAFCPDPAEVLEVRWFSLAEIRAAAIYMCPFMRSFFGLGPSQCSILWEEEGRAAFISRLS